MIATIVSLNYNFIQLDRKWPDTRSVGASGPGGPVHARAFQKLGPAGERLVWE
jgi:hypothetical protein